MVKKLHLGHVAKSFALKEQPSLVGRSVQKKHTEKRKRDQKTHKVKEGLKRKRKMVNEVWTNFYFIFSFGLIEKEKEEKL